tara:strand:+ start:18970 stop:20535 length:1566 start_codon:yes stop_codon:yes gene_type:complete
MLGFFLVGFFVVLTGAIGMIATGSISERVELVTQVTSPTVALVNGLTISLVQSNKLIHAYASEFNSADLSDLRRLFDKQNDVFDESERSLRKLIEDEEVIDRLNLASKKYDGFKDKSEKVISTHKAEIAESNDAEKTRYNEVKAALLKQVDDDSDDAIEILQEIAVDVSALNAAANKESVAAVRNTRAILGFITVIGLFLAIAIGFFFTKLIVRPVNELASAATKVSEGNFDVKVKESKSNDELNHLANTFNKMVVSLRNMVEESPRLKRFMQLMPSAEKSSSSPEKFASLSFGTSYVLKGVDSKRAFELFVDKVMHGSQGLCLSRTNPLLIRKQYKLEKTPILWLSDAKESNIFSSSDLLIIGKLITDFLVKSKSAIILLDRVDYLIAKHGFDEVMKFMVKINDKIMLTRAVLLVPIDPSLMKAKELSFLSKEMQELDNGSSGVDVPRDLVSVLSFIESRRHLGEQVSFKDIGQKFNITAPTTQKRVHELYHLGLLRIVKQGRNKLIELTDKGAEAVSKE